MLTGIHFILTYSCNFECDHCFLYCGPKSQGTFTINQVARVLDEAEKMGTVKWVYYEGGEPFLFFPSLVVIFVTSLFPIIVYQNIKAKA